MDLATATRHQSQDVCAECWAPLQPGETCRCGCRETITQEEFVRIREQTKTELRDSRNRIQQIMQELGFWEGREWQQSKPSR